MRFLSSSVRIRSPIIAGPKRVPLSVQSVPPFSEQSRPNNSVLFKFETSDLGLRVCIFLSSPENFKYLSSCFLHRTAFRLAYFHQTCVVIFVRKVA